MHIRVNVEGRTGEVTQELGSLGKSGPLKVIQTSGQMLVSEGDCGRVAGKISFFIISYSSFFL